MVPTMTMGDGRVSSYTPEIASKFKEYYENLYRSRQEETGDGMDSFFRDLNLPYLSEADRIELDRPITLEEIQRVTNEMASQKSPCPDGLPAEIYQHYGKILFSELLKVLIWSVTKGALPPLAKSRHDNATIWSCWIEISYLSMKRSSRYTARWRAVEHSLNRLLTLAIKSAK